MCKFRKGDTIDALRGMVFYMNLGNDTDNKNGTIIKKCRPCVIVSVDEGFNELNPTCYTVVPISSRDDSHIFCLTDVLFTWNNMSKAAIIHQMTTVSYLDMKNYTYTVGREVMKKIDNAIMVHTGMAPYSILDITEKDVTDYSEYKKEKEVKNAMIEDNVQNNEANEMVAEDAFPVVTNINEAPKDRDSNGRFSSVVKPYRSGLHVDINDMRTRGYAKWTMDEIMYFLNDFNNYNSSGAVATKYGIKPANIYYIKANLKKKVEKVKIKEKVRA